MKRMIWLFLALALTTIPNTVDAQTPREIVEWIFDNSAFQPKQIIIIHHTAEEWHDLIYSGAIHPSTMAFTDAGLATKGIFEMHLSPYPQSYNIMTWVHEAIHYLHANLGSVGNEQIFHTELGVHIATSAIICGSQAIRSAFPEPTVPVLPKGWRCDENAVLVIDPIR